MRALETWTWMVMRLSSMVLALAVFVHLGTMIYAIQGGLSAEEILARTQGHTGWYAFYIAFLLAAAVHSGIGLRNIVREHTSWRGLSLNVAALAATIVLAWMGLRALEGLF
jgi:fumarate reductase subunit C